MIPIERSRGGCARAAGCVNGRAARVGRGPVAPVDLVRERLTRTEPGIGECADVRQAQRGAFGHRLVGCYDQRGADVPHRHLKSIGIGAAVVVGNRHGHRVNAAVRVRMTPIERSRGGRARAAGRVNGRGAAVGRGPVAPVDLVRERLTRTEPGIGERADIRQTEQGPFIHRLIGCHDQRGIEVPHRHLKRLGIGAAVVVGDRHDDRVDPVVRVRVIPIERSCSGRARAAGRVNGRGAAVGGRAVAPVDRVAERLLRGRIARRIAIAWIAERADVHQTEHRPFVHDLITRNHERGRDVFHRHLTVGREVGISKQDVVARRNRVDRDDDATTAIQRDVERVVERRLGRRGIAVEDVPNRAVDAKTGVKVAVGKNTRQDEAVVLHVGAGNEYLAVGLEFHAH